MNNTAVLPSKDEHTVVKNHTILRQWVERAELIRGLPSPNVFKTQNTALQERTSKEAVTQKEKGAPRCPTQPCQPTSHHFHH